MSKDPNTWSFEEFRAFLLIYASHADLDFSEEEYDAILAKIDHASFEKVNAAYNSMGEFERLDFILKFRSRFFPDQGGKKKVLNMVKEHFVADGEESKLESNLYDFLERLF